MVVDLHAVLLVVFDHRGFEIQSLDRGHSPDSDQYFVGVNLAADAVALGREYFFIAAHRDAVNFASRDDFHAVADDGALDSFGSVAILANQDLRRDFQQSDLRAKSRKRLRQLASDRSRADHGDSPRQLGQRENRFVGQVAGLGETRNRQRGGARSSCDRGLLEFEPLAVNLDDSQARRIVRHR